MEGKWPRDKKENGTKKLTHHKPPPIAINSSNLAIMRPSLLSFFELGHLFDDGIRIKVLRTRRYIRTR